VTLLEIGGLKVARGEVGVLEDVSMSVRAGETVAVLGANGAGKTTLLRALSGLLRPVAGTVRFDGTAIEGLRPHEIARLGLMHVPEGRGMLPELTVEENLALGLNLRRGGPEPAGLDALVALFPVLGARRTQQAGMLSGGEQQMLAIARALAAGPRMLMIDELSLGLAPKITVEIMQRLRVLRDGGLSVLLVEQNAQQAMRFADRVYVLAHGGVALSGTPSELASDAALMAAYLGRD
jgi:branched-chain amino acid transport system ATP-binding protein